MAKNNNFEIRPEQRQSWQSIAAIWAGGMICVPCLMIGGVLSGGGLSIADFNGVSIRASALCIL